MAPANWPTGVPPSRGGPSKKLAEGKADDHRLDSGVGPRGLAIDRLDDVEIARFDVMF